MLHPGTTLEQSASGREDAPTKRGTVSITLEIDLRRMTRKEAGDDGPVPFLNEYTPREIADLIAYGLDGEDAQAEMFAGSMIFVKISKITVKNAAWVGDAKLSSTANTDAASDMNNNSSQGDDNAR